MLPARSVFSSVARSGGVRGYATAATAVSARPPVALFGVDGTYASALVSTHLFLPSPAPPPLVNACLPLN
jgi:hypothetical protein